MVCGLFYVSLDYIFARTDQPQGKLYDFKPKIEDNEDMRQFIEMCFDPNSPMSGKLKDTFANDERGRERMNLVFYGRYSDSGQSEQSIEGQRKACFEYAERNGYNT